MTDQHRATPEQWAAVEEWATKEHRPHSGESCLLELRARVEALEAGQRCRFVEIDTSQWTDDDRQRAMEQLDQPGTFRVLSAEEVAPVVVPVSAPVDSLVERVALALDSSCPQDEYVLNDCRAAIREVAAWMDERCIRAAAEDPDYYDPPTAADAIRWLRDEATR